MLYTVIIATFTAALKRVVSVSGAKACSTLLFLVSVLIFVSCKALDKNCPDRSWLIFLSTIEACHVYQFSGSITVF